MQCFSRRHYALVGVRLSLSLLSRSVSYSMLSHDSGLNTAGLSAVGLDLCPKMTDLSH